MPPSGCTFSGHVFSQGILFANFSCLCSLWYAFQPHSKLCIQSQGFLIVFYVLSGSGSGSDSPGGTILSILVPSAPPGDTFKLSRSFFSIF